MWVLLKSVLFILKFAAQLFPIVRRALCWTQWDLQPTKYKQSGAYAIVNLCCIIFKEFLWFCEQNRMAAAGKGAPLLLVTEMDVFLRHFRCNRINNMLTGFPSNLFNFMARCYISPAVRPLWRIKCIWILGNPRHNIIKREIIYSPTKIYDFIHWNSINFQVKYQICCVVFSSFVSRKKWREEQSCFRCLIDIVGRRFIQFH